MADQEKLQQLFNKYLLRECTPREVEELVSLLKGKNAGDILSPRMQELWNQIRQNPQTYPVDWERMYQQIQQEVPSADGRRAKVRRMSIRVAAAIAGIVILSGGWYLWSKNLSLRKENILVASVRLHDVPPGGNKAVLTLANGATIILDQAANGTLTKQGNSQVVKLDSGELAYQPSQNNSIKGSLQYNILATPRGGQYQLRLSDGTKVWLNAASSIRFPTAFTGKERQVEITGEAYFEVAQDAYKPFIVTVRNMQVMVLGTQFNVNAYSDETVIKTTLVEGKVKVQSLNSQGNSDVMTPGQQIQLEKNGQMKLIRDADVSEEVAWKNGLFVFHNDDLPAIMRRLARWYKVEVAYKNSKVPVSHFTGAIRRQENISKVLNMLELTGGANFDIEGRTIIVSE